MNKTEFLGPWVMLCERFNRKPSQPVMQFYVDIMRQEGLSAEEWRRGVFGVMRFEQFWPSPEQLLEHARGGKSLEVQAQEEFAACLARAQRGEAATLPNTYTRTLMNSVTNGRPLGELSHTDINWAKREFVQRFTAHLKQAAVSRTPALEACRKELPDAS